MKCGIGLKDFRLIKRGVICLNAYYMILFNVRCYMSECNLYDIKMRDRNCLNDV